MKRNKLAKAETLLKEIAEFLDDNMGWIAQGGEEDKDLFILANEMNQLSKKIKNYIEA